ncbi:MAG: hypothetical protein R6U58_07705 [Bacteroidales bacterium]
MKRFFILLIALGLSANMVYPGGIMTNTNQSTSYIRMLARDASLGIDAAYYNPAGLTRLADGFHFSLNNQSVFQNRSIRNDLATLNQNEFKGKVTAPLFPSVYAAYKTGKLAFSFGFNPVGGGGGAVYEDGLPSFEAGVSSLVPMLSDFGVTGYRNDIYFEGSSIFFGGQLGVSYVINDMFSLFGGARYVVASNTYEGYLRDIEVDTPVGWMKPGTYLRAVVGPNLPGSMQPLIEATADALDEFTADAEVDVAQKGNAITPLIGLSITPNDRFNIGIKYEFLTKLELENETEIDGTGMFPDRAKTRNDMPALISVGAAYKATSQLNISGGVHYYFDKAADYGKPLPNEDLMDNNYLEVALGLEYGLTDDILVSAGYLRTQTGVNEEYHSDMSHSLSTNSLGFGGRYAINEMIAVNLGFLMTSYEEDSRSYDYDDPLGTATETYNRDNMVFAIGLDFKF